MEEFPLLMEYQKKYGKRGSEAASLWLLRKRTLILLDLKGGL